MFRTTRINEVVKIIYIINNGLYPNKNGTKKDLSSLSHQVTMTVQNSNLLLEGLKLLNEIVIYLVFLLEFINFTIITVTLLVYKYQ